jgi:hypothetical protein
MHVSNQPEFEVELLPQNQLFTTVEQILCVSTLCLFSLKMVSLPETVPCYRYGGVGMVSGTLSTFEATAQDRAKSVLELMIR